MKIDDFMLQSQYDYISAVCNSVDTAYTVWSIEAAIANCEFCGDDLILSARYPEGQWQYAIRFSIKALRSLPRKVIVQNIMFILENFK